MAEGVNPGEIRCESGHLLGIFDEQGRLEVRCSRCQDAIRKAHGQRVVVLHYIGAAGIEDTRIYGDPAEMIITKELLFEAVSKLGWRIAK